MGIILSMWLPRGYVLAMFTVVHDVISPCALLVWSNSTTTMVTAPRRNTNNVCYPGGLAHVIDVFFSIGANR